MVFTSVLTKTFFSRQYLISLCFFHSIFQKRRLTTTTLNTKTLTHFKPTYMSSAATHSSYWPCGDLLLGVSVWQVFMWLGSDLWVRDIWRRLAQLQSSYQSEKMDKTILDDSHVPVFFFLCDCDLGFYRGCAVTLTLPTALSYHSFCMTSINVFLITMYRGLLTPSCTSWTS